MADETTGPADAFKKSDTGGNAAAPTGAPSTGAPVPAVSGRDVPAETQMGADIAKILSEVKIPERRDQYVGGADAKPLPKAAAPLPASAPVPAPPPSAHAVSNPDSSVVGVHTLKQDLQHVVKEQKISLVHAVSLEQGRERPEPVEAPRPRSNALKNVLFAVVLLLGLGGAALFGVYTVTQQRAAPLPQTTSTSLVFAERTVQLPIDGQTALALKTLLAQARSASTGSLGSITRIAPTKQIAAEDGTVSPRLATFSEFMAAIGAHPPEDLMRALTSDFFFGFHTVDKNAPLLVVKVNSYERAFAGMLAWEKSLNADLAPIYISVPTLVPSADGIPVERTFQSVVMRNYDVRALKDDGGQVQLYYSFPTRDTLIIAESPYTFTELLSRLQAGRTL